MHVPSVIWLLVVAAMVGAMTVIGGVTRLTESGLSMVEWRPLIGALPPFSDGEWARVFALYQTSPEYQKINSGMSLAEFKQIFWWEYIHRFWGRLIGLAYAAPMAFFWIKGGIPKGLRARMILLLALGGSQGVIGWWMVKSGLVDRPDVSHFRLAIHLGMAFIIAGALVWTALDLLSPRHARGSPKGSAPHELGRSRGIVPCHHPRCVRSRDECRNDLQYLPAYGWPPFATGLRGADPLVA